MNKYLEAMLRGCIQGLTEFLPVSSSGHLLLLNELGFGEQCLFFDILLHISTLLVIVIVFRKSILFVIKNPLGEKSKFIIIASIPTAIISAVIRYFLYDFSVRILPFCFMLTTVMLFSTKYASKTNLADKWRNGYPKVALISGIAQGLATLSGVSRSGAVITTMRHTGMKKEECGELTFLLSIPIIIGSAIIELICYKGAEKIASLELIIGMIFAFLSGLLAIKTFIKIFDKGQIWIFGIYTFLLSIVSFYVIFF